MPTALEKLIALSGSAESAAPAVDPASDVVLAAAALADDLRILFLAWSDDDDDDSDDSKGKGASSSKSSGGGNAKGKSDDDEDDDEYAAMVKKLVAKGVPMARAKAMAKNAASKKVAAAASLVEGISVALSAIAVTPGATLEGVRQRMEAAARSWQPNSLGLASGPAEDHLVRLAVLTTEQRKKPSAHTIPGSDDFPIPDKAHLTAAVGRYHQGALAGHSKEEVARHIRSRAKALGEEVDLTAA